MNNKIDFVVMWVDGNDENWRNEKEKYLPDDKKTVDSRSIRYRDWENLKYFFRGVEKFAPFVNRVHFVTWGHLPEWLNTDCPKLSIVKHSDYIPSEYLPTFSANPIELNLHRIKDLSENFVFFNDDMFIIKPVKETDFFVDNTPCDSAILSPVITYTRDGFAKMQINDISIINDHFDKNQVIKQNASKWLSLKYGKQLIRTLCLMPWKHFAGFLDQHIAISYNKKTFETLWNKEFEVLDQSSKSRFRNNNTDVNNWLMRYWQLCSGNFTPRKASFGVLCEYAKNPNDIYNIIRNQKYSMVCLNDGEGDFDFEKEKQNTIAAFESILPEKCSFEK